MPSEKILAAKKQVVADLVAEFKEAKSFVFASTRGLTVAQDTELRNELRKNNVKFKVIKNTVLRLVFKELGIEGVEDAFVGPTTVAYSEDVVAPAKIVCKFAEQIDVMEVKSGVIDGKAASKDEVIALSKVPDVTTLYSQVVFGMLFPMTKLAMLVKAVAEKAQEEGGAPVAAPAAEEAAAEAPAEAEAPVEA
ncbi:MAG: 50S ribosomal protein L10 [Saccharofermentans sp.]|nr:50S ribosomal protein L10 [Saccharofermentans sp.]